NIARNAAQAIASQDSGRFTGRGCVTLRTRVSRQVTLCKRRHRLALQVQVIDDGPGVADDIRERMFYPLVSGHDGGSGLGLTLAQSFVQQHQGTIDCDSRSGETCFTVRLPLA
ncbi:MAG TPA: ATP-binding protein, partial [Accumulibacter sp.]|nr:ATP-binding protein [Accumulibacter sp.]